ncbi:hypothetical protein C478_07482 [Natrinema thermotolerans DSM 11552]|nr:hypothetical protein C478_07482 [Natrinema thermotolerans DSM 11552]
MGALAGSKNPYAPWGDKNAPAECNTGDCPADRADSSECDCDARYKWGYDGHYRTGDKVDMCIPGIVKHRAYIFSENDVFLFVDADDVRCPVTGAVHPVFLALMAVLGLTWCEVSVSGSGVHAVFRGSLPENAVKEPVLQLDDEPWGENDGGDLPEIEIYPTKHVGVLTGRHVPGTPVEVRGVNESGLSKILDAHGKTKDPRKNTTQNVPELTGGGSEGGVDADVVTDMDDVFDAVDALDARDVADQTIVQSWSDPAGTECRAFLPTWGSSSDGGTANIVTEDMWEDRGNDSGLGGPIVMAAIDKRILSHNGAAPGDVTGRDVHRCLDHLRGLGFDIPEYVASGDTSDLYMDVLGEYKDAGTNPWENPDACLVASIEAREDGAVTPEADAPTLALHAIIEDVLGVSADSHAVTDRTYGTAQAVFDDMEVADARDVTDLPSNTDSDGDGDSNTSTEADSDAVTDDITLPDGFDSDTDTTTGRGTPTTNDAGTVPETTADATDDRTYDAFREADLTAEATTNDTPSNGVSGGADEWSSGQ